jgi:F-type H+-transporting ATPase subunit a
MLNNLFSIQLLNNNLELETINLPSPLEQFETTNFVSFTAPILGDFVISLTNVGFYSLLVLILVVGYHALSANNHGGGSSAALVPSK